MRLELVLPPDQSSEYSAQLVDDDGRILQQVDGLEPRATSGGRLIDVTMPANRLIRGQYRVKIRAGHAGPFGDFESYSFRVP